MDYEKIIKTVNSTIKADYYYNFAPVRKEKKSLVEELEKVFLEGKIPLVVEIVYSDEKKSYFSSKNSLLSYLELLSKEKRISAFDIMLEPRIHGGDLRWLNKDISKLLIVNDYIIDSSQLVGGDAVILDPNLLAAANVDLNYMIDQAHDLDFETLIKVKTYKEFQIAKKTEADIILIENISGASENALSILNKSETKRPILIKNGFATSQDIRDLIISGAKGFELSINISVNHSLLIQKINQIDKAIKSIDKDKYEDMIIVN